MSSRRFETLDAMRGLAALLVIPRHTELFGTASAESHSYLAVDLFFMLSGFVIAHAYERQILAGAISIRRFIAIRLVRLYPIFVLGVLLATIAALTRGAVEPNALAKWTPADASAGSILTSAALALFYLPSKIGDSVLLFPLNTAFWSLMFELVANVLYVMVCRHLSLRNLWWIVASSGLAMSALALRRNGIEMGWSWGATSLTCGLLRTIFGFTAGVLLFRLFQIQAPIKSNLGALSTTLLVMVPLLLPNTSATNGLVDVIAVVAIFPIAILMGAHSYTDGWTMRSFGWLGASSYSIYVLHVPLLVFYERGLAVMGVDPGRGLTALPGMLFIVAMVLLALALDRWYDQPIRKALTRWLRLRPVATTDRRTDNDQPRADSNRDPLPTPLGTAPGSEALVTASVRSAQTSVH